MSISWEKDAEQFEIICDECGSNEYYGHDREDFFSALNEAKADGWRPIKLAREWVHYCSQECLDNAYKKANP